MSSRYIIALSQLIQALFHDCCPDCPVYLNSFDWATWAIWAAIKTYSFKTIVSISLEHYSTPLSLALISLLFFTVYPRLREDLEDPKGALLEEKNEECTQAVINLLLGGRATPHLHNGTIVYDQDGNTLVTE